MPSSRRSAPLLAVAAAALLLAAALAGCAGLRGRGAPPAPSPPVAASEEELWDRYGQAVAATRYPTEAHLYRSLVALHRSTEGLVWNDQGKVLMTSWTRARFFTEFLDTSRPLTHPAWLTAGPFLQRFCRRLDLPPDRLRLRLAQRLGLPPTTENDSFVEMWVDPAEIFRPCADPEVTDGECQLDLSTGSTIPAGSCPWRDAYARQTSARFVTVSASHLDWLCGTWQTTHTGDPRTSFPWTALGYTYDWGSGSAFHGESEFVAPAGTTVTVRSITPTAQYCGKIAENP